MPRRSKAEELLDFEIVFFERLLRAHPDFVDVLIPLAHAYTRRGFPEKGLEIDLRLSRLRGQDPLSWYNLACSYSLLSRVDEALQSLLRAVELGYTDLTYLQNDPDLANLRRSPKFRQLLDAFPGAGGARKHPVSSQPSNPSSEAKPN